MVRAEEAAEEIDQLEAGNGRECGPRRDDKECLGLCECPRGWNSYISLLNQVQCQEVLPHGCPRTIVVKVDDTRKNVRQVALPPIDIDRIIITFNEVCISNHIFVRPYCQFPICLGSILSTFTDDPQVAFASVLDVIDNSKTVLSISDSDDLLSRIEALILSVRGIIFNDGGLGVAAYVTTPDCRHVCKPGFAAALEIIVRPFQPFDSLSPTI